MDKTKAIIFALIQGSELADNAGSRGYTLAGLESLYAKMSAKDRANAESMTRHLQTELERHGFAVGPKERMVDQRQADHEEPRRSMSGDEMWRDNNA